MVSQQLISAGLSSAQAEAYMLLLKEGAISPPQLARRQKLTRTNAYKVLDKLVELGLAHKKEKNKKFVYSPDNPLGLTNLVAEQRNIATAREEAVKHIMSDLLEAYHQQVEAPNVQVVTGREAVSEAYRQQIRLQKPIYFIRSRADIPSMGFDVIHEVRVMPARHGQKRFGITPDLGAGPINPEADKRSNLKRTWVKKEDYDAPVEWSVSGSTLLIVLFGTEPHAITITNPLIATAFKQLYLLIESCLRAMPYYKTLPRTNQKRTT